MAKVFRSTLGLTALVIFSTVAAGVILVRVVWPAYQRQENRTFDSRLGYSAVQRALGQPFNVETTPVQRRAVVVRQLGEGRVTAMPIRVPLVPTERVLEVAVKEGERVAKGQLLAKLDPSNAELRLASARLHVENAQAELERVKLGSAYTLTQERPEREGINLEANRKQVALLRERYESMKTLQQQGGVSRLQLLELEAKLTEAERELRASELGVEVSTKGQPQSTAIAENNLRQAQNVLRQRERELEDFVVRAPADGVLEEVRIHAGEYNRNTGDTGFVIASGLWFEAHLDQTALNKIKAGDRAQLFLEALAGTPVEARVTRLIPIVTYSTGGPDSARPTRALGMGAPEWPTTFTVIIDVPADISPSLAPGLTGFAKIEAKRESLAVPRSAVHIISSKRGFVTTVKGTERTTREVVLGEESDGWITVEHGLNEGDVVAVRGHEDLQPGDAIRAVAAAP